MKKTVIFMTVLLVVFTACQKKVTPPELNVELNSSIDNNLSIDVNESVESNKTSLGCYVPSFIVIEEELADTQQNNELIQRDVAAKLIVFKEKRVLVLLNCEGDILSRHKISLGENPVGTKLKQGDHKTPEGTYSVVDMRSDPKYYREILISYPNVDDRKRSRSLGFNPGGGITIHAQVPWNWNGNGDDYTLTKDWTSGCVALTNEGMDMVWSMVNKNTVIEIQE
jgi:murein L,D-transpeptidase YafK